MATMTEEEIQRKWKLRTRAFEGALREFQNELGDLTKPVAIDKKAPTDLSNVYWTLHERDMRKHVEGYTDRFKMASLTEKAIFLVQPFKFLDGKPAKAINARFAFTCALTVMDEMREEWEADSDGIWAKIETSLTNGDRKEAETLKRLDNHKVFYDCFERTIRLHKHWLDTYEVKEDGAFPVLHNAVYLDLLWHSMHFPFQATP